MSGAQANPSSPISQLLLTLGLTREDLHRHSDQMRQFLTAEHANSLRALSFSQEHNDLPKPSSSRQSFKSSSVSRSNSARDASPDSSVAKVKSEPDEPALLTRQMGSMEMVLERQSRQAKKDRKTRKMRDRASTVSHNRPCSPSPSHASSSSHPSLSLDSFMQSRDVRRVSFPGPSDQELSVVQQDPSAHTSTTPSHSKYYRDYSTVEPPISRSQKSAYMLRDEQTTPSLHRRRAAVMSDVQPVRDGRSSPLPPSSPPGVFSSPLSSPAKVFNTVSSPGPMDPLPLEEDYDDLPYTLPPGPYSKVKPELSYAALVGQAIISSHQHRLTLQEIYDWITIVYPYFQRGETTWMNSIRHVLSTTACFRKVVRDRSMGRTLWAIWDEDLPCFEGGGFKKHLCRDMESKPKGTAASRKRNPGPADDNSPKKSKRHRKEKPAPLSVQQPDHVVQTAHPFPFFPPPPHGGPMFPPIRPSVHHQPYYESCLPQSTIPAEIIFPPLPPSATYGFHPVLASSGLSSVTTVSEPSANVASNSPEEPSTAPASSPRPSTVPWPSSMPGLTPNRSSSPSPSLPSDAVALPPAIIAPELDQPEVVDTDDVFTVPGSLMTLEPGMTLLDHAQRLEGKQKGKGKAKQGGISRKKSLLPPMPTSPTLGRKVVSRIQNQKVTLSLAPSGTDISRCTTPPSRSCTVSPSTFLQIPADTPSVSVPITPPRTTRSSHKQQVNLSPIRTPLSHRGLHMSPSASLAHYKSHLDPPPAAIFASTSTADTDPDADPNMRTPVRKFGAGTTNAAFTPRRLFFASTQDSPLRTPSGRSGNGSGVGAGGTLAPSPLFRTPGSRSIFDPHDPGALLDEELSRLGGAGQLGYIESPSGMYGKGGLFYESPSVPSPMKWSRWW